MTRIKVDNVCGGTNNPWVGRTFPASKTAWGGNAWDVPSENAIFAVSEVHEVVSHRGEYHPNHPGELDPDAWDRESYADPNVGRHLLHTGTE